MAWPVVLHDVFFMRLELLTDYDVLELANASREVRRRVVAAGCHASQIQLLPGVGVIGLWNVFELSEVAIQLRDWQDITVDPEIPRTVLTRRVASTCRTAFQIAKDPIKNVPPWKRILVTFRFPPCDLRDDDQTDVISSQVEVPDAEELLVLVVTKVRGASGGRDGRNVLLWRTAGGDDARYAFSVVSVDFGFKLINEVNPPMDEPPVDEHRWLADSGSTLRKNIEHGRDMMFIVSLYNMRDPNDDFIQGVRMRYE